MAKAIWKTTKRHVGSVPSFPRYHNAPVGGNGQLALAAQTFGRVAYSGARATPSAPVRRG